MAKGDRIEMQLIAREILYLARQIKNPNQVLIVKGSKND